jgi:hypothetical protein
MFDSASNPLAGPEYTASVRVWAPAQNETARMSNIALAANDIATLDMEIG